jgi:hypothetical protein
MPAAGLVMALATLLAPGPAGALENGHFIIDPSTGFAAQGYDPVAYFVDRALRPGAADYETMWGKAAWRFANEGNRAAFVRDPLVYAPTFGGHCPVALAKGYPAEGDPRLWAIHRNRLYFFYSQENMQEFIAAPDGIVAEAQQTWDKLFPY